MTRVRFLGLYDAVDMTTNYGGETISGNVETAAVIYAAGNASENGPEPRIIKDHTGRYIYSQVRSRRFFIKADHGPESSNTDYDQIWIFGTHSTIGGAPFWGDAPAGHTDLNDRLKAEESDEFIRDIAQSVGLPINDEDDYGYDLLGEERDVPSR